MKEYIHFGSPEFDKSKFRPVVNSNGYFANKPLYGTGLWASPVGAEWGWGNFCRQENFYVENLRCSFRFTLKKGARVLHIREMYDLVNNPHISLNWHDVATFDYETLAKEYDAIEFHFSESYDTYFPMYGWDCDSIVILNPDIVNTKKVRHSRRRRHD